MAARTLELRGRVGRERARRGGGGAAAAAAAVGAAGGGAEQPRHAERRRLGRRRQVLDRHAKHRLGQRQPRAQHRAQRLARVGRLERFGREPQAAPLDDRREDRGRLGAAWQVARAVGLPERLERKLLKHRLVARLAARAAAALDARDAALLGQEGEVAPHRLRERRRLGAQLFGVLRREPGHGERPAVGGGAERDVAGRGAEGVLLLLVLLLLLLLLLVLLLGAALAAAVLAALAIAALLVRLLPLLLVREHRVRLGQERLGVERRPDHVGVVHDRR